MTRFRVQKPGKRFQIPGQARNGVEGAGLKGKEWDEGREEVG